MIISCEPWVSALPEFVLVGGIAVSLVLVWIQASKHQMYPTLRVFGVGAALLGAVGALLYDTTNGLNLFKQGLGLDISLHHFAFGGSFGSDVCSKLLKLTLNVWALLYVFEMSPYLFRGQEQKGFYEAPEVPFFFALLGGFLTLSAQDLRLLFLGTEVASLATLILLKMFERPSAGDIAFRVFILNCVGAAFILLGITLLGGLYGTTNVSELTFRFCVIQPSFYNPFLFLAFMLMTFGYLAKMRLFPFHGLTMDVAEGTERPLFPFLTFFSRFIFITALLKLFILFHADAFQGIFLIFGSLNMIFAALAVFRQNRIQPLLTCLTLAESGLWMVGFAIASTNILPSLLFSMVSHALAMLVFLGTLLWVQDRELKIMTLHDLSFVSEQSSVAATLLAVSVLSLVGFPLSPGFVPFVAFVQHLVVAEAYGVLAFVVFAKGILFGMGITVVRAFLVSGERKNERQEEKLKRKRKHWREGVLCGVMIGLAIAADHVLAYFSLAGATLEWHRQK